MPLLHHLAVCRNHVAALESQQVSRNKIGNWRVYPLPITLDHGRWR